jgi:hypothetical protein
MVSQSSEFTAHASSEKKQMDWIVELTCAFGQ